MNTEDRSNYTYNWATYNSSYKPVYSWERVYKAFQYQTSTDLNGYPIVGTYNNYWGGGYVYEMRGQKSYLKGNLTLLQKNNWIDRQTRAVIIEFSIFNPNINLIAVAEILIEILPTGTIVQSARFDPISLFSEFSIFIIICDSIYILFIIYFTIHEIVVLRKQGKNYFLKFWSYVEWAIIGFSWTVLALSIYRINASSQVSEFFKKTSGYGYFKMQDIAFWNLVLNYSFAFCIAFGTLKFLKIFRFNAKISYLGLTLRNCAKELLGFGLMFILIWIAFVQLFHLFFQRTIFGFSTVLRSMVTGFQIMLGKFQLDSLVEADSTFGPIFYCFYNICIVFILLTMFISIINESFKIVRKSTKNKEYDYNLVNFIRNKFKFKNKDIQDEFKIQPNSSNKMEYKDHITYFGDKVDELLIIINDVSYCFYYIIQ
jgi:polycystin 1L2